MSKREQIILDTIVKALSLVDEADKANTAGDKSSYQLFLWKSGAEAEYVAFQISATHGLSDYEPQSDKGADDPQTSTDSARMLLQEAESSIKLDPHQAYRAVRSAVTVLRKLYVSREKAQKQAAAQSLINE